ncbi:MAG: CPBP family intramembrane metalloprotease [Planctomycetaceae bacterium]|nr:CPBP family intramembrane metalloprotease [Planctomycetaceae bacterium]
MDVTGQVPTQQELVSAALGLGVLMLLVFSSAQWITWIRDWLHGLDPWTGRPRAELAPPPVADVPRFPLFLALIWLGIHIPLLFTPRPEFDVAKLQPRLSGLVTEGIAILLLFVGLFAAEAKRGRDLHQYGLVPRGGVRALINAGRGLIAAIAPVACVLLLTIPLRSEEQVHPLLLLLKADSSFGTFALVLMIAAVLAPLNEELIFRVILQSTLLHVLPPQWAIVLVALAFAAIHGLPDALPLLPLALVLGYIYYRDRSFLTIVLVHALFNGLNVLLLLAGLEVAE